MSDSGEITVEDLLAEAKPRTVVVRVLLRQDLFDEHRVAEDELQAANARDRAHGEYSIDEEPESFAAADRVKAIEAEIEAATREFVFRSIGKQAWSKLIGAHPPTREQLAQSPRLDNNPETFPAVAIAASCISPAMTLEHVRKFEELLDYTQFTQLYQGALEANIGGGAAPKSLLAGGIARAREQLGQRPTPTESLDLFSLDGSSGQDSGDPARSVPTDS